MTPVDKDFRVPAPPTRTGSANKSRSLGAHYNYYNNINNNNNNNNSNNNNNNNSNNNKTNSIALSGSNVYTFLN